MSRLLASVLVLVFGVALGGVVRAEEGHAEQRAQALLAEHDGQVTKMFSDTSSKRWTTVAEAATLARALWDVTIEDRSGDPKVGQIRFCFVCDTIEKEMALPVFAEALAMAVASGSDCRVEKVFPGGGTTGFREYKDLKLIIHPALKVKWDTR